MSHNPFNEGTQIHKIFEILSDLKWHCSEHELPWSQPAKALQMIRQKGYVMEKVGSNYEKRILCSVCGRKTPHRKLASLEIQHTSIERTKSLDTKLKERIISLYNGEDAILWYAPTGRKIEVDHRIPQIRWIEKEEDYEDMTDEQLKAQFMLLVREHNLLKSRFCEKCKKTNTRQKFLWIKYFFQWNENYTDNLWCKWCGWHNPEEWKASLNNKLSWN